MSATVGRPGHDDVSVAPFREAFLRLEPSIARRRWGHTSVVCKDAGNIVAERLGWYDHGNPDGPRVRRVLGLRTYQVGGNGRDPHRTAKREYVTRETAFSLCDAMNLDPVDMGL